MDAAEQIQCDLKIPHRFSREVSRTRCVCVVEESWLQELRTEESLPLREDRVWQSVTEKECGVLLAPSYATIAKPWLKVSIKVIHKQDKVVHSFVSRGVDRIGPSLTELLSHVSEQNFHGLWDSIQAKHPKARMTPAGTAVLAHNDYKAYNEMVKDVLSKLFKCKVISVQDSAQKKDSSSSKAQMTEPRSSSHQHPNLVPVYGIFESSMAFHIVQPYIGYKLHDVVTFSPTLLSGSFAKPLFVLYQVLNAVKHSHELGLSVGELNLHNILMDEKLWVQLAQPHLGRTSQDVDGVFLESSNNEKSLLTLRPAGGRNCLMASPSNQDHIPLILTRLMNVSSLTNLPCLVQQWVHGEISNFHYLMILNHLTGRRMGDPNHHPVLPWVMDFSRPNGGYRDLTRSKFRLNKGDRQLDLTYDTSSPFPSLDTNGSENLQIPHHISDVLSDITYYVYTARRTPKSVLCAHVRSKWVPNEYPSSMQRMQEWTPDECIPEFFTDPTIFTSIHEDLPDLEIPAWASSPEELIKTHMAILEGEFVSHRLHHWIDLTFGYKLSGSAAVKAKNVCLQLVDQHTELVNHGVVQLFHQPHPPRLPRSSWALSKPPRILRPNVASPVMVGVRETDGSVAVSSVTEQGTSSQQGTKLPEHSQYSLQLINEVPEKRDPSEKRQKEGSGDSRPEEAPIYLPKGFDPLGLLEQMEAMYNFSTKSAHCLPPDREEKTQINSQDIWSGLMAHDMQAFGCLVIEFFQSSKLRVLAPDASLSDRYSLIRKVFSKIKDELPRPARHAVQVLLQLNKEWKKEDIDKLTGSLFNYKVVCEEGLPPASATLLLHPHSLTLPFPPYFPGLYQVLTRLKQLDVTIEQLEACDEMGWERRSQIRNYCKEKVYTLGKYVSKVGSTLGSEGLGLLIPYITEMFENPASSVQAAWSLFDPVSQVLGPQETAKKLLGWLTKLFDGENSTRKHMKLYHRSFVIQLLVRLGAKMFLSTFATLLIEASAGYRNFAENEERLMSNDVDGPDDEYPSVFVDERIEEDPRMPSPTQEKTEEDLYKAHVSVGEEAFPEDVWPEGSELLPGSDLEKTPSESGSGEPLSEDKTDSHSLGSTDQADVFAETASTGSVEPSEDMLGRSFGRLSVHSVSRLLQEEQERNAVGGDTVSGDDVDIMTRGRRPSNGSLSEPEQEESASESKGEDIAPSSLVRSETEEFTSSILESSGIVDYNINHVAAETIKWLSHRLGPLLTAKWLSRNLLRMLALCYYGEEQLEPTTRDVGNILSTTKKHIVGDYNASQVLECLACMAVLYGEHVILLQFFPHAKELVTQSQRKMTGRSEAGIISNLSLLISILPYLSDATLMDILQETIFKDLLLPLLKMVSSLHVSFTNGVKARTVICHKLIDALYIISLRIGFEMTRQHMTFILQKFFAVFNRVYDEKFLESKPAEETSTSPNQEPVVESCSSVESVYVEIKRDSETGGYKIGTPTRPSAWQPSHQRQGSGGFRYSLSPAPRDEKEETDTKAVESEAQMMRELRQTFSPQLAHLAYIPFCRLAGGIHMEQNLINDDLIRQLCTMYDEALSKEQAAAAAAANKESGGTQPGVSPNEASHSHSPASEEDDVGGNFGRNVSVAGNKIMIADDEGGMLDPRTAGTTNRNRRKSGETMIDYTKLRSPEMDINKQRHLKGNWLAYWEHELGLSGRETCFNFKQIKLQTFSGHSNSVRSLHVLDNENSFISASKDKTVKLWSLRNFGDGTGRVGCQWTYNNHKKSVFAVTFLESVRLAASCDSIVHIWDPFMGMVVRQLDSVKNAPVTVLTPMPAPHTTIITATTDANIRFLDVRAGAYMHDFKCSTGPAGLIRCATVSPDGRWVAVGYSSGIISIVDIRTGLLLATWKAHEGEILQIKSLNNKSLLTSSFDQTMTLWNVEDAKALCHFKGPTEPVHCVTFYRNEIISATTANRVGVHTSVDRKASYSSTKLRSDVFRGVLTTMAVLPENRLLLLGADNGTIRLLA